MSHACEVRAYEYVARPYPSVRDALAKDAAAVFQGATSSAAVRARSLVSTLHSNVGPFDVAADVIVDLSEIEAEEDTPLGPRTRLHVAWKAAAHSDLFGSPSGLVGARQGGRGMRGPQRESRAAQEDHGN
jgi:hypothetical protein